jgi:hypothetical protein
VLSLRNADFLEIDAIEWHRQFDVFLNNDKWQLHLDADGCNDILEIIMYAGRPVVWALVRHDTAEVYSTVLGDLKDACDGILQLQQKECLQPSCAHVCWSITQMLRLVLLGVQPLCRLLVSRCGDQMENFPTTRSLRHLMELCIL